jgi:hypothetical protein
MATDTEDAGRLPEPERELVLDPVDRVSEMLFGLFMALTFVGAISVVESGRAVLRSLLAAALGCNRAWGLVDAVMFLMRTDTERGRWITLLRSVRAAPDAARPGAGWSPTRCRAARHGSSWTPRSRPSAAASSRCRAQAAEVEHRAGRTRLGL